MHKIVISCGRPTHKEGSFEIVADMKKKVKVSQLKDWEISLIMLRKLTNGRAGG
jgi:hypothetical protein